MSCGSKKIDFVNLDYMSVNMLRETENTGQPQGLIENKMFRREQHRMFTKTKPKNPQTELSFQLLFEDLTSSIELFATY